MNNSSAKLKRHHAWGDDVFVRWQDEGRETVYQMRERVVARSNNVLAKLTVVKAAVRRCVPNLVGVLAVQTVVPSS